MYHLYKIKVRYAWSAYSGLDPLIYNYFSEVFQEDQWSDLGDSWLRDDITISLRITMQQLFSELTGIQEETWIFGKTGLEDSEEWWYS